MIDFFMVIALSCSPVQMINETNEPWNDFDYQTLNNAKKRCGEIYPDAPCVKKFYKRPEQSYWAICGAELK